MVVGYLVPCGVAAGPGDARSMMSSGWRQQPRGRDEVAVVGCGASTAPRCVAERAPVLLEPDGAHVDLVLAAVAA